MTVSDHWNRTASNINALWNVRVVGGSVVKSDAGITLTIPTSSGASLDQPTNSDLDPGLRQFVHLARPFSQFNSVGTGFDYSGTWPSTGAWGQSGDVIQPDELYRALINIDFDAYLTNASLYFLESESDWSIDTAEPIFRGAVYAANNELLPRSSAVPVGTSSPEDDNVAFVAWRSFYPNAEIPDLLYQMYDYRLLVPNIAVLDNLYGFDFSGPAISDQDNDIFDRVNPVAMWSGAPPFFDSGILATRINAAKYDGSQRIAANTNTPIYLSINSIAMQQVTGDGLKEVSLPRSSNETSRVMLVLDLINIWTGQPQTITGKISLETYTESSSDYSLTSTL